MSYDCVQCVYKTDNKKYYERHLKTKKHRQNTIDNTETNEINNNETNETNETNEIVQQSNIPDKIIKCDKCKKQFKSKYYLKTHQKSCKDVINPSQCEVCNHTFEAVELREFHQRYCVVDTLCNIHISKITDPITGIKAPCDCTVCRMNNVMHLLKKLEIAHSFIVDIVDTMKELNMIEQDDPFFDFL